MQHSAFVKEKSPYLAGDAQRRIWRHDDRLCRPDEKSSLCIYHFARFLKCHLPAIGLTSYSYKKGTTRASEHSLKLVNIEKLNIQQRTRQKSTKEEKRGFFLVATRPSSRLIPVTVPEMLWDLQLHQIIQHLHLWRTAQPFLLSQTRLAIYKILLTAVRKTRMSLDWSHHSQPMLGNWNPCVTCRPHWGAILELLLMHLS